MIFKFIICFSAEKLLHFYTKTILRSDFNKNIQFLYNIYSNMYLDVALKILVITFTQHPNLTMPQTAGGGTRESPHSL
jgi:hypothetical protein